MGMGSEAMSDERPKLAFVMPWYGEKVPGGAESEARRTMKRLVAAGYEVTVLTTCIRDSFADWGKNYHRPGRTEEGGLIVQRFAVNPRDKKRFELINWQLMQQMVVTAEEEIYWLDHCFSCPDLYRFIAEQRTTYLFFFIPYLFPSTVYGAQIAPERSVVVPCLHDEGYAYTSTQKVALSKPAVLLFHAESEKRLAERLVGEVASQKRLVVGGGIETEFEFTPDEASFRRKFDLVDVDFVLYVGRKEGSKNVPLLFDYWRHFLAKTGSAAKLVLMGPDAADIPADLQGQIVDLGFVSVEDKRQGYAAASVLCQPSVNESFSIVMMECWMAQTPVLVHGDCAVTREFCVEAQGGLYFTNQEEFAANIEYLWRHRAVARQMGANGRAFVLEHYRWEVVLAHYEAVIADLVAQLRVDAA